MYAWNHFLILQEKELGPETVNKWLRPLKIIKFDACNLYLEAKNSFQILWFEEHMRPLLLTQFVNNNQKKIKVHLTLAQAPAQNSRKKNSKNTKSSPITPPPPVLALDELDPYCRFENYIIPTQNDLPYKLFHALSEKSRLSLQEKEEVGIFNPIYVYGPTGTGKTHLLMSVTHSLRQKGLKVVFVRAETFTEHVVNAIRASEMGHFREMYRTADVLIVDNLQVFSRKSATQEEFFHTFNTLHQAGKQMILAANLAPGELPFIEPRLISRFEWGIVLALELPTRGELVEIVDKKTFSMGMDLHPKVKNFLVETFSRTTKTLIRAIEALALRAHTLPSYQRLTIPITEKLLHDLIKEEMKNLLTAEKIVHAVAEFYGIRSEDILGKAQTREFTLPRQMTMYLCRHQLKIPFMKIGDLFQKDHSTVMSSVRLIQKAMDANNLEITQAYASIQTTLKTQSVIKLSEIS